MTKSDTGDFLFPLYSNSCPSVLEHHVPPASLLLSWPLPLNLLWEFLFLSNWELETTSSQTLDLFSVQLLSYLPSPPIFWWYWKLGFLHSKFSSDILIYMCICLLRCPPGCGTSPIPNSWPFRHKTGILHHYLQGSWAINISWSKSITT